MTELPTGLSWPAPRGIWRLMNRLWCHARVTGQDPARTVLSHRGTGLREGGELPAAAVATHVRAAGAPAACGGSHACSLSDSRVPSVNAERPYGSPLAKQPSPRWSRWRPRMGRWQTRGGTAKRVCDELRAQDIFDSSEHRLFAYQRCGTQDALIGRAEPCAPLRRHTVSST